MFVLSGLPVLAQQDEHTPSPPNAPAPPAEAATDSRDRAQPMKMAPNMPGMNKGQMDSMHGMGMMHMTGQMGLWSMSREGSGTSWLPDSSPMYGRMAKVGRYDIMQMGQATAVYTDSGRTERVPNEFYGLSQYMVMVNNKTGAGDGILGLRFMGSLDPITMQHGGYPNLFQTGETFNGKPLKDRQHPHDLVMELSALYSRQIAGATRGFLYLAPVGEPAIGPTAYPHRPSAMDNPLAPISHHWFDGTHISYGVVNAGVTQGTQFKLEGSIFTGREPNENRYDFGAFRFDSYAGRVTYNPTRDLSFQTSYAFIKSPESLEEAVNINRFTISGSHNLAFANGDNLATTLIWGRNHKSETHAGLKKDTDALLLETNYTVGRYAAFGRYDNTEKDEVVDVPEGVYRIQKFTLGGTYNVRKDAEMEHGPGLSVDFYSFPSALKPYYGSHPVSFNVFYRIRFGRMDMSKMAGMGGANGMQDTGGKKDDQKPGEMKMPM